MKIPEKLRTKEDILQFLRFCIIGVLAAAVHYGVYLILQ
jgi:putative flippase GtrA